MPSSWWMRVQLILWVTVFRDPRHSRGNQTDPLKDNKTKSILNHIAFPIIPFVKSKSAEGWNWVESDGAQDTTCSRSRGRTKWGVTAEGSLDFNTAVPGSLWCHHDGVWLCCGWVWIRVTSCKVQLLPHRNRVGGWVKQDSNLQHCKLHHSETSWRQRRTVKWVKYIP